MSLIVHNPYGVEHPYARSLDQLSPSIPVVSQPLVIGVIVEEKVDSVHCVIVTEDDQTVLVMHPVDGEDSDAALLAGGTGHLAEAQQAAMKADNGWQCTIDSVSPTPCDYRFEVIKADGTTEKSRVFHLSPAAWKQGDCGTITGAKEKLIGRATEWLVSERGVHRVRFALALRDDEHVIGFGERYDYVDQRGHHLDSVVFEQYKGQGKHHRTYLPMPYAQVIDEKGQAWGFHVDTSRRVWFDVGETTKDRITIEAEMGEQPVGQANLDLHLWCGTPADVLSGFLEVAGSPEEMPEWVFGLWASGNEWNTQQLVMQQMDRHQEENIPVSVVVIEAWSDEEGFTIFRDAQYQPNGGRVFNGGDFTYPHDGAWPNPQAMIRELHKRGTKVILWQIPLQQNMEDLGEQATLQKDALIESGHYVREADGSPYRNRGWWFPGAFMPDFSTEDGRKWWTDHRRYLVRDLDIDGFKTDGGEHAWGHDLRYADGKRGDEGNNLVPVNYARAYGDLLKSEGKAPVTFSRAGFTGSQAHGIYWAGDEDSTWEAFRSSITAGITAGVSGILYWGWDIAGFSGELPEAELYARAMGASTFMPIMQYHSEFNNHQLPLKDRTPWNVAEQRNAPEIIDLVRHFVAVRDRLRPYLVQQARESIRSGKPLMRALFFDYGHDRAIWAYPQQYQLGDALLINPITRPDVTEWKTYLPLGHQWRDFWTGELYEGGQLVASSTSWMNPPVYINQDAYVTGTANL